ncbi:uncharacterized protein Triagg1_8648 [Trichoderma aggressivum f. europaeum]|uniref:Uncharacterized protein n=1 Tax=Trichoderma aggressivum f. europaeum TaxID=173218 RepID=A0AAE1I9S5_9HYPO|nr:hypothetical protein Triagg1_8648 [Trichoderma aggressivum f. europaeum]
MPEDALHPAPQPQQRSRPTNQATESPNLIAIGSAQGGAAEPNIGLLLHSRRLRLAPAQSSELPDAFFFRPHRQSQSRVGPGSTCGDETPSTKGLGVTAVANKLPEREHATVSSHSSTTMMQTVNYCISPSSIIHLANTPPTIKEKGMTLMCLTTNDHHLGSLW